jgi:hypothetical protein
MRHLFQSAVIGVFFAVIVTSAAPGQAVLPSSAADPATAAGFVPHRAIYDISLSSAHSGSQIVNISGQMLYEWRPSCEGWLSHYRFNLTYEYADNPAEQVNSDFTTFERYDGSSFDFSSQRLINNILAEELRGHATSGPIVNVAATAGEIVYDRPSNLHFDLPAGSYFPMAHTLSVLKDIQAGRHFASKTIFDGSDTEGPATITSFWNGQISGPLSYLPEGLQNHSLLKSPAHNLRLAFFSQQGESASPDYEMSMTLHQNGIISIMNIDYGNFGVRQTLRALEPISGGCDIPVLRERKQKLSQD